MAESLNAFFSGLGIGLSFILAIGAQNAFVLKQGLKRQFVFAVCLTCAFSDTLLIITGVIAHQEFSTVFPKVKIWLRYLGGSFLILYGIKSFYNALTLNHSLVDYFSDENDSDLGKKSQKSQKSQKQYESSLLHTLLTVLAFTWLNPHVYLDTLIVIGSLSLNFSHSVISYTLGAVIASYLFFFSLGYGARILTPWFKNPWSWKILDGVIAVIMLALGGALLLENF